MSDDLRELLKALPPDEMPQAFDRWERVAVKARRRSLTVVTAAAAGIAAVVTAALVFLPGVGGDNSKLRVQPAGSDQAIAWIDKAAPTPGSAEALPRSTLFPACSAGQLAPGWAPAEVGDGPYTRFITLTNIGTQPCSISGMPLQATGTRTDGTLVHLDTTPTDGQVVLPADLRSGDSAQVAIGTTSECAQPLKSGLRRVSFAVRGGGDVEVSFQPGNPFPELCGVSMGPIGAAGFGGSGTPLDRLQATAAMPGTIPAGEIADFTVTLTNPTDSPILLSPCPSYTEYIQTGSAAPSTSRYYLNCGGANGQIAPNESLTFAMRLQAPDTVGSAHWGWGLQGTNVQIAGGLNLGSR